MDYDDLLRDHVGEFGLYQRFIFVLVSLSGILTAYTNLGIVFIAAAPEHWCHVDELEYYSHDEQRSLAIPKEKDVDGDKVYSSCEMFER